jgi:hypothetical protein
MRRAGHRWRLAGGGGGWEVWECVECGRSAIPSFYGGLWPNLLGFFFRRWRCS